MVGSSAAVEAGRKIVTASPKTAGIAHSTLKGLTNDDKDEEDGEVVVADVGDDDVVYCCPVSVCDQIGEGRCRYISVLIFICSPFASLYLLVYVSLSLSIIILIIPIIIHQARAKAYLRSAITVEDVNMAKDLVEQATLV